jgi:hypothetical protein
LALVDRLGIHLPSQNASGQTLSVADLLSMSPVDPSIKKVVAPLAVAAGNDIDKFRQLVESWFDSAMQRVSGWYKKRIQLITLLVAAAVCLLINADTLSIADTLWSNPTVRTQLAGAAKSVGPLKVGQTAKPPGANVTNAASTIPTVDPSTLKQSESLAASLIGWHGPILPTMKGYDSNDVHRFPNGGEWVWKLVGILISAIAVSLGAPFWFDTLNRIMNIRGAGGSPVEAGAPQRIASSPTLSGIPVPASGAVDPSTGTQETKQP